MDDCIFCKIIKRKLPSEIIFEDDDILAFSDVHPVAPVHVLVIPKKHIVNLEAVLPEDKDILGKILLAAKKVADIKGINNAFRVMNASGKIAGQSVFHMHFHVVGGWKEPKNLMREDIDKMS